MKPDFFTNTLIFFGRYPLFIIRKFGEFGIFLFNGFLHIFSMPLQFSKIINEIHFIGARSVFVICLTGSFTGMVLAIQGYYTLVQFGSVGMLGAVVALTIIRELGPTLTAIMIVARAGSAITAEIGIMRNSEQIDALDTMDINPIRFLVSPKIAAALISFPLLTALFDVIGILGGLLVGSGLLDLNSGTYFYRLEKSVVMADITLGFVKSIAFAIIVISICSYHGYYTHLQKDGFGAKGVSLSTTSAVVKSSVLILVADYIITSIML